MAKNPDELTDEELKLLIARENLKRYGNPLGPPEVSPAETAVVAVKRIAPKPRKGKAAFDQRWFSVTKKCPHCGKVKNVGKEFGVVIRRGVEAAAGWCKQCRSSTNYRAMARKNRSAHHEP
jgi:hypothetical protein